MAEVHNPRGLSCRAKRWRDAGFDAVEINLKRDWPFGLSALSGCRYPADCGAPTKLASGVVEAVAVAY
jgi:hypothetical protein